MGRKFRGTTQFPRIDRGTQFSPLTGAGRCRLIAAEMPFWPAGKRFQPCSRFSLCPR